MSSSAPGYAGAGSDTQTHWRRREIVSLRQDAIPNDRETELGTELIWDI